MPRLTAAFLSIALTVAAAASSSSTSNTVYARRVGAYEPTGVHLALGTADDEMSITWATLSPAATVVSYGQDSSLSMRAKGSYTTFVDGGLERLVRIIHVVVISGLEAGVKYEYAVGDPTKPGGVSKTFFFFAKRSDAQISDGPPLKLLAFCDVGHLESSAVLALIEAEVHGGAARRAVGDDAAAAGDAAAPSSQIPDALIHCGDLAYDMDSSNGRNGDAFLRDMEPIAAYVPYMISAGNHEHAYNFSHYAARFSMPGRGRDTDNHYYSLDIGPVHLVAYNGEAFYWPQYFDADYMARMYEWLEDDLRAANANRAKTPWIVVHAHRPMYCVDADSPDPPWKRVVPPALRGRCGWEKEAARRGVPSACADHYASLACSPRPPADVAASYSSSSSSSSNASASRETPRRGDPAEGGPLALEFPVEQLFYRHGVDVAFFGHIHDYERFYPVYDEVVLNGTRVTLDRYYEPAATVHVTTGSGGNPEMIDKGTLPPGRGTCSDASPWCAFQSGFAPHGGRTADFTYSRITVHNDSTLEWEQISALAAGAVIDRFYVETPVHGSFAGPKEKKSSASAGESTAAGRGGAVRTNVDTDDEREGFAAVM